MPGTYKNGGDPRRGDVVTWAKGYWRWLDNLIRYCPRLVVIGVDHYQRHPLPVLTVLDPESWFGREFTHVPPERLILLQRGV